MLTRKQFDILVFLSREDQPISQRELAEALGFSVGTVNKLLTELAGQAYVDRQRLTDRGFDLLENYRVKRAIFLAAGFGSRMLPITLNTPKPLVRVKGRRLIDSLLDAVIRAGISEIFIVRGYLAEQFDQLLHKYPDIHFVDNPLFSETNSISSALAVADRLGNAYVMDADLLLKNEDLIRPYQYDSNYLGVPVRLTDDWCLEVRGGRIQGVALGGENCHSWIGLSHWTQKDGKRLEKDIREVYRSPGGREKYWDMVPLVDRSRHYRVSVRECSFDDIQEIDTFSQLKRIDPAYDMRAVL